MQDGTHIYIMCSCVLFVQLFPDETHDTQIFTFKSLKMNLPSVHLLVAAIVFFFSFCSYLME